MRTEEDVCFVLFMPVFPEPRIVADKCLMALFYFKILRHFIYFVCLCVLGDAYMPRHTCENQIVYNVQKSVLFFHHMEPGH